MSNKNDYYISNYQDVKCLRMDPSDNCQKFIDGVLVYLIGISMFIFYILFAIIFLMLLPFFIYPLAILIHLNPVCILYKLCWSPLPMMLLWVNLFILIPATIFGLLSCLNVIKEQQTKSNKPSQVEV